MTDPIFPEKIANSYFVNRFSYINQTAYVYAIYKDKHGKKFFAKGYSGSQRSKKRLLLEREVAILQLLEKHKFSFVLPVVGVVKQKWRFIVLFPYISSKELIHFSQKTKITTVLRMLTNISSLTKKLENKKNSVIPSRPGWLLVLSYPYILIKALIAFPELFFLYFHSLKIFINGAIQLFQEQASYFAHRDIHLKNILKHGKKEVIVDWPYAAFTVKDWDFLMLLINRWDDAKMRKVLLKYKTLSNYHISLGIFIATLFLTDRNLKIRMRKSVIKFLLEIDKIPTEYKYIPQVSIMKKICIALREVIFGINQEHLSRLPKRISGYALVDVLSSNKQTNISVGVYQNKKHERVIVKLWEGKRKTLSYINLRHEIAVYQVLTKAIRRVTSSLKNSKVLLPSFISYNEQQNRLILMRSYIEGRETLSFSSPKAQLTSVKTVIDFLQELTNHLTQEEKYIIGQRTLKHFLLFLPLVIVVLIKKSPKKIFLFIRVIGLLLRGVPSLLNEKEYVLTHGDLHGENIFLGKGYIGIIDCEQMRITYPHYDVIASISSRKTNLTVASMLLKSLLAKSYKRNLQLPIVSLMINCSLQNLMTNSHPKSRLRYQSVLDIGSQLGAFQSFSTKGVSL